MLELHSGLNVGKLLMALAIILCLLMIAIPATPALAAGDIELDPEEGKIGTYVRITGEDFPESTETEESLVDIYFSREKASVGEDIDDDVLNYEKKTGVLVHEDGTFSTRIKVPDELNDGDEDEDVYAGRYYFYATYGDADRIRARASFTVIVAGIGLDPDEGAVGTEVEISGEDFAEDEDITIKYDGEAIDIASGDEETESDGEFTCTIVIPKSIAGDHTITAVVDDEEAGAEFTVEPVLTISPTSGIVSDRVRVSGTGFGKSKDVTITFGNTKVATDETNTYGSFEASFNVPSVGPGTYDVTAEDERDNEASAKFRITTDISISPTTSQTSPGHVGTEITVSGTGFRANHDITITYASEPVVFHTTSGSDGSFSYTFEAPPSQGGAHTITASDGTNTIQATFTMESTPPATPQPLLPLMGDKEKSRAYFDWKDVDDPSKPVTYTLQIASDANFTTIVLEKEGLTTSEYTLTEQEKLQSTKKEAPYYWRVRAIDSASNTSGWTGAGTFYVGFTFELAGPILYALMGVGGLILLIIGFFVGRRTSVERAY